jgi:hypothetical protein
MVFPEFCKKNCLPGSSIGLLLARLAGFRSLRGGQADSRDNLYVPNSKLVRMTFEVQQPVYKKAQDNK